MSKTKKELEDLIARYKATRQEMKWGKLLAPLTDEKEAK